MALFISMVTGLLPQIQDLESQVYFLKFKTLAALDLVDTMGSFGFIGDLEFLFLFGEVSPDPAASMIFRFLLETVRVEALNEALAGVLGLRDRAFNGEGVFLFEAWNSEWPDMVEIVKNLVTFLPELVTLVPNLVEFVKNLVTF